MMKCQIGAKSDPCKNEIEYKIISRENGALYLVCKKHKSLFGSNYKITKYELLEGNT